MDQMTYLYNAVQAVQATEIDHHSLSYARSQVDKDGSHRIERAINQMRHALVKDLVNR